MLKALFLAGLTWMNVSKPVTADALHGRVVLLDFWTYCCINCIQVIPELKALEAKYAARGVVVIGVHSGKFDNEKDPENIRAAIKRYDVRHPVVDDSEYQIWDAFSVQAWPTLIVIGSDGKVVLKATGEGHQQEIDAALQQALAEGKRRGDLVDEAMPVQLEKQDQKALAFPGKIIAANGHLFISDTSHDRVVEATESGEVIERYEGDLLQPQGLAVDGQTLYVADTGHHRIRAIDLKSKVARTIAGTGVKGRPKAGDALQSPLASPWDVLVQGGVLYVANAGTHQLLGVKDGALFVAAGTGREARIDGNAKLAALAQPSGLAGDGKSVFIADSEVSSVRRYDPAKDTVETLVGEDLFVFGDKDGAFASARLQHCLGLVFSGGALYVADTYNHKVKRLDLEKRTITTLVGDGKREHLFEPSGLTALAGKLYIADTNHSRIVVYDPKTRRAGELVLKGSKL